jgi:tRNA-Thr(GGU) m(6)t(6)A37 methyltransferase TsaA
MAIYTSMTISYNPIGTIYTPFDRIDGMPIQSKGAEGFFGKIVLNDEYTTALKDLDSFSHIILLYHFHKVEGFELLAKPFLDDQKRGVFSIRAPKRPNPIGISIVRLQSIEGNVIHFENADMLNKTPLLDIKPYVPDFDVYIDAQSGWVQWKTNNLNQKRSDERFK